MFISPQKAIATSQITVRTDAEMEAYLGQLSSALHTNRSTLVRIAVLNMIDSVKKTSPSSLEELINHA